jgi:HTH-like domain
MTHRQEARCLGDLAGLFLLADGHRFYRLYRFPTCQLDKPPPYISRGSVYYESQPISDVELKLMRRIDELHLELPFAGARMLRDLLRAEGFAVGRKHMTTLMRRMGITALYRKPNTSKKVPGQTIWPYLLRTLAVTRSSHVWAMDIRHPDGARVRLPGGRHRLAQPQDFGVASVDLDGHGVLHGSCRRSHRPPFERARSLRARSLHWQ